MTPWSCHILSVLCPVKNTTLSSEQFVVILGRLISPSDLLILYNRKYSIHEPYKHSLGLSMYFLNKIFLLSMPNPLFPMDCDIYGHIYRCNNNTGEKQHSFAFPVMVLQTSSLVHRYRGSIHSEISNLRVSGKNSPNLQKCLLPT